MSELLDLPTGGTGLLAIFCDLDEADQADFRPWLTEDMFPARVQIGVNACASYDRISGEGQGFLTLYEMPTLGHLYGEAYQGLRRQRNPRDAAYHEKFRNLDRYTLAWAGPELASSRDRDVGLAPYLQIDRFDLEASDTQAFNIWFATEYLPVITRHPGDIRVRRYLSMEGQSAHVVLHEIADPSVTESNGYGQLGDLPMRHQMGRYQQVISSQAPVV
jgi:hypothetical protein